jgi:hypothetical protein
MGKNYNTGILNFFSNTQESCVSSPHSRPSCGCAFYTFWFFYVKKRREKICINQSLPFFITLCNNSNTRVNIKVWSEGLPTVELTAWSVAYGRGFSHSSLANLSVRSETSIELSLDISLSKSSFLDSKIFLSACVCVWMKGKGVSLICSNSDYKYCQSHCISNIRLVPTSHKDNVHMSTNTGLSRAMVTKQQKKLDAESQTRKHWNTLGSCKQKERSPSHKN